MAESKNIKVDYFCDKKAIELDYFHGIPVINVEKLNQLVSENNERATIIICVGINKGTVNSIYKDLLRLDINADVFDYFENTLIFSDSAFNLDGKIYNLFEHSFNCGYTSMRMTERSVELALANDYICRCDDSIIEIGAVTPYYFFSDKIIEIVDPTDIHKAVTKKSLFECDLKGKNVLSISTVEHIGTSDYGMSEKESVITALEKILKEAKTCLITAPLGYNKLLDDWVRTNWTNNMIKVLKRSINNHWDEVKDKYIDIEYTPLWANGLVIIEK